MPGTKHQAKKLRLLLPSSGYCCLNIRIEPGVLRAIHADSIFFRGGLCHRFTQNHAATITFFIAFAIFLNLPQNDEYLIGDYTHNFSHSAYKPFLSRFLTLLI
ncbi:MAG: hypothetical protein Q3X95_02885 [Duodenibacillus sp.]|nr:hypothetical protein [Duodenibacillus sp.]